ncbi:MAG: hypothetical protein M0T73_10875 [Deltaproteobacteria bacterium]|nr:hypothetical protein [Deltaproteobacteria bacterium]
MKTPLRARLLPGTEHAIRFIIIAWNVTERLQGVIWLLPRGATPRVNGAAIEAAGGTVFD